MYRLPAEEYSPLRDLLQRLHLCISSYIKTPYDLSILHFGERIHYKVIGGADFVKTACRMARISRDISRCFDFLSFYFLSFFFLSVLITGILAACFPDEVPPSLHEAPG